LATLAETPLFACPPLLHIERGRAPPQTFLQLLASNFAVFTFLSPSLPLRAGVSVPSGPNNNRSNLIIAVNFFGAIWERPPGEIKNRPMAAAAKESVLSACHLLNRFNPNYSIAWCMRQSILSNLSHPPLLLLLFLPVSSSAASEAAAAAAGRDQIHFSSSSVRVSESDRLTSEKKIERRKSESV
jgi:hypothetical protein